MLTGGRDDVGEDKLPFGLGPNGIPFVESVPLLPWAFVVGLRFI